MNNPLSERAIGSSRGGKIGRWLLLSEAGVVEELGLLSENVFSASLEIVEEKGPKFQ